MIVFQGFDHRQLMYTEKRPRLPPVERPLLPGYHFVAFDVDADRWQPLVRSPGVLRLLGCEQGGEPAPLPPGALEELEKVISGVMRAADAAGFAPGDRVRITGGPLTAMTGPVLWCDGRSVRVSLDLMGSGTPVTMTITDVELAEDDPVGQTR